MMPEVGSFLKAALAVSLATAVHAGALVWIFRIGDEPGAISRETASISLNLVETVILQAPVETEKSETAAPESNAIATPDLAKLPKDEPDKTEIETEAGRAVRRDEESHYSNFGEKNPPPLLQGDERAASTAEKETRRDRAANKRIEQKKESGQPDGRNQRRVKKIAPKKRLSARSRGRSPSTSTGGRVSASRGKVRNYSARVRARIARKRPPGHGVSGTAIVAFAISRSGGVRYARIHRSSGHGVLDRAAISAIRRAAPFPSPPKGMTLRQLSYTIPFRFK